MVTNSSRLLQTLASLLMIHLSCQDGRSRTVCQNEAFEAECRSDEVVMMQVALYGRRELSRCVDRNYGYVGCASDVLRESDYLCSGTQECRIPIPNTHFDQVGTCPNDLKSYLNATYTCLKVLTAPGQDCIQNNPIRVDASVPGFLSSVITERTRKGSHTCPWVIVAQPGQKLNISLIDFTRPGSWGQTSSSNCQAYASYKEPGMPGQPQTICGGDVREKHIFLSNSESLEIRFFKASKNAPKRFLLKYEAISCPDPDLPANAEYKKENDFITVSCTTSKGSWRMRCENNQWKTENGKEVRCAAPTPDILPNTARKARIPFGLSVVIIASIALILGVLILLFGLFVLKRRRRQQDANMQHFYQGASKPSGRSAQLPSIPPGGKDQDSMYQSSENEYEYINELPPHYNSAQRQPDIYQGRKHDVGHCKQHPQGAPATRKQLIHKEPKRGARHVDGFEPPAYFELDPEGGAAQTAPANGTAMTRVNQSVHEFSPYGYDHLLDQSGNSNHKSV